MEPALGSSPQQLHRQHCVAHAQESKRLISPCDHFWWAVLTGVRVTGGSVGRSVTRLTGAIQQTTNIKALQIAKLLHLEVHVPLNISECLCPKTCKESCVLMTPASQGPGHVNCFRRMHLTQPQGWSEHHSQTHIESYLFWLSCLEIVQLVL